MEKVFKNAQSLRSHRDNFGVGANGQFLDGLAHEAGFGQVLQLQHKRNTAKHEVFTISISDTKFGDL